MLSTYVEVLDSKIISSSLFLKKANTRFSLVVEDSSLESSLSCRTRDLLNFMKEEAKAVAQSRVVGSWHGDVRAKRFLLPLCITSLLSNRSRDGNEGESHPRPPKLMAGCSVRWDPFGASSDRIVSVHTYCYRLLCV